MKRWNVWQGGTLAAALWLCLLAGCGEGEVGIGGTAQAPQLPTQPGPFGVGVQQITFTKKSVTTERAVEIFAEDAVLLFGNHAAPLPDFVQLLSGADLTAEQTACRIDEEGLALVAGSSWQVAKSTSDAPTVSISISASIDLNVFTLSEGLRPRVACV